MLFVPSAGSAGQEELWDLYEWMKNSVPSKSLPGVAQNPNLRFISVVQPPYAGGKLIALTQGL